MLSRVKIENYRCLKDIDLELGTLTALVGPNASGKSSLLKAMTYKDMPSIHDSWMNCTGNEMSILYFDRKNTEPFGITHRWSSLLSDNNGSRFGLYLPQLLDFDLIQLRKPNQAQEAVRLDFNGQNLANVISTIPWPQRIELSERFCELVPVFRNIDVRPNREMGPGNMNILFQDAWSEKIWYTTDKVSDGSMLLLAFLTLQYQPEPPTLLAIEEPDRGLHPYLLENLVLFLRGISTGEIGDRPVQVVLATHSSELLEYLEPEEVRFMSRNPEDGSVQVKRAPTDSPNWKKAFSTYEESLRNAWLSGGLGGVPGN